MHEKPRGRPGWMHCLLCIAIVVFIAVAVVAIYFGLEAIDEEEKEKRTTDPPPGDITNKTVLIFGAGVAGLRAAQILSEKGVGSITVLEALDRVGGRVKSVDFHGDTVELGASWIQGMTHNPVWKMAQEALVLGYVVEPGSYAVIDENGQDRTEEADELYEEHFDNITETIIEMLVDANNSDVSDMTMRSALRREGWSPPPDDIVAKVIEVDAYDWEEGATPDALSARYSKPDQIFKEDDREYVVLNADGFQKMPEFMLASFLSGSPRNSIVYNTEIMEITARPDFVSVKTSDGKSYKADYAITTIPLGVLQHGLVEFNPPLPESKRDAIFKHGMGYINTIYAKFSGNLSSVLPEEEFIMYASEQRGYYAMMVNYIRPSSYLYGKNLLRVDVAGQAAQELETKNNMEIKRELQAVLQNMFPNEDPLPDIVDIVVSRWSSDPYAKGAQSVWPFGMTPADFQVLNAPYRRLYFAGEAHSRSHGYLQGAFLSGEHTARNLVSCMSYVRNCQ